jgi:hypothetical protein
VRLGKNAKLIKITESPKAAAVISSQENIISFLLLQTY